MIIDTDEIYTPAWWDIHDLEEDLDRKLTDAEFKMVKRFLHDALTSPIQSLVYDTLKELTEEDFEKARLSEMSDDDIVKEIGKKTDEERPKDKPGFKWIKY